MHDIKKNFDKFLPIVNSFLHKITIRRPGRTPKFTDAEVITLSLVSESLGELGVELRLAPDGLRRAA